MSQYWQQTDQFQGLCLKGGRLGVLNHHRTLWITVESTPMATPRPQLGHQGGKAMNRPPVGRHACAFVVLSGGCGWSRRDGITVMPVDGQRGIITYQWRPRLTQVPFNVIRQQADEEVS